MQLWDSCQKLGKKKLIRFGCESVHPLKITKRFRNKTFPWKVGQHKRFSFGHVESSFLKLAEKVPPNPWQFAFNVQKSHQSKLYSRIMVFLKRCSTERMQSWQIGRKFFSKSPRFVKKFRKKFWFHSFFWLTAFHRLFLWTPRALFWKSARNFLAKVRVLLFKNRKRQFKNNFFSGSFSSLKCSFGHLECSFEKLAKISWKKIR